MPTVTIVDDEPLAVRLLETYVERHPDLRLAGSFTNPVDALEAFDRQLPDLVLLDIQMPELNGLHLARLVRGKCALVFTTAYADHALAGFELDAADYLLKPIAYERFARAVAKALPEEAPPPAPTHIFVKSGRRNFRIPLADLRYASADGDYLSLYLTDGRRILTLENLGDLLARLPAARFRRIHRSHFVALDKVEHVERRRVFLEDAMLPVSDSYRAGLLDHFGC